MKPQASLDFLTHHGEFLQGDEIAIDVFAGGGGVSLGYYMATGREIDVAINHDPAAISVHQINHPNTVHVVSDVFEVDPRTAVKGRRVGLAHFSPDCTDFSKAKGGKPMRDRSKKRRALAWIVIRWAGQVRPRVITLENVEEFADWGPLVGPKDALQPCKKRRGQTFKRFVRLLEGMGYSVEWRELRACDYGAPTIRKRLFLIARCDGRPIVWPEATHGPGLLPYRTAAECIDWSIPMLSIFATKDEAKEWGKANGQAAPIRPLAENTMRRIARGVKRYVLENPKPFLVQIGQTNGNGGYSRSVADSITTIQTKNDHCLVAPVIGGVGGRAGQSPERSGEQPFATTTGKADAALFAPYMVPRYGEREGQEPRSRSVQDPMPTVVNDGNGGSLVAANLATYYGDKSENDARGGLLDEPLATQPTENRHALVTSFLTQNNGGFNEMNGRSLDEPVSTVLCESRGHHGLIAANLIKEKGTSTDADVSEPLHTVGAGGTHHGIVATHIQRDFGQSVGSDMREPIGAVTGGSNGHAAMVAAFLQTYYGQGIGQQVDEPLRTIPTLDNFGFVTVKVDGELFYIADIAMRMLQPRELYRAQGFPDSYVIDRGADGRLITKTEQVRMVGNSVVPQVAAALIAANVPEMVVKAAA